MPAPSPPFRGSTFSPMEVSAEYLSHKKCRIEVERHTSEPASKTEAAQTRPIKVAARVAVVLLLYVRSMSANFRYIMCPAKPFLRAET